MTIEAAAARRKRDCEVGKMKKYKAGLFLLLALLSALFLSGCRTNIAVDTLLTVDEGFSGSRKMTLQLPDTLFTSADGQQQSLEKLIKQSCPASLSYVKSTENGVSEYVFTLGFSSYSDYIAKINGLLGREAAVVFSTSETVLMQGCRINEDFESSELFSWLLEAVRGQNEEHPADIGFVSGKNAISFDGKTQTTGAKIGVNAIESLPIDEIRVQTTERADGKYDRTISFRIPYSTVNTLGADLISYMNARTGDDAKSSGWTDFDSGREYTVTYEGLTPKELSQRTNLLLQSPMAGHASYQTDTDGATPFSTENTFEENLDLSAYASQNNGPVKVSYTFKRQGESGVRSFERYQNGGWQKIVDEEDGVYTITEKTMGLRVRVKNGKDYPLESTDITLSCEGGGVFTRTVAFHYQSSHEEGADYLMRHITHRSDKITLEKQQDEAGLTLTLTIHGTAEEISSELKALFGKENQMEYHAEGAATDLNDSTTLTDAISMDALYEGENKQSPMRYTIKTNGKELLDSLRYSSENKSASVGLQDSAKEGVTFTLDSKNTVITYNGKTPNPLGVTIAFFLALCAFAAVIAAIIFIRRRGDGPKRPGGFTRNGHELKVIHSDESVEDILAEL